MSLEERRRSALRARAHPLRLQMLSLLTGAAMSAAELARELGISQALASYHLRFLEEADAVQLVEEVANRGGRERRFRYIADAPADAGASRSGNDSHELLVRAAVAELQRRQLERDPEAPGLLVDAELWVTDEQWLAFRDAVREAGVRLHEQAARPRSPGTRRVSVTAALFAMTAAAPPPGPAAER